jgi:hypothetical protein
MNENTVLTKPVEQPSSVAKRGRVFVLSLQGIPRVTTEGKKRMETAARTGDRRRGYPQLVAE